MNDQAPGRMRGVGPCYLAIGELILHAHGEAVVLPRANAYAGLLVPLRGGRAQSPSLVDIAAAGSAEATLQADALVVHFRKDRLNAEVSRRTGDGRRLAPVIGPVVLDGRDRLLERAIEDLWGRATGSTILETTFYEALGQRIIERDDRDAIMARMRAVSDAMRIVRAQHRHALDVDRLASMVGVTADTLRKGFRACLGVTVGTFVHSVRLEWAFRQLSDLRECRSIAEIAIAAGFGSGQSFSRHYVRRFAETPTQTRARAVRMMA